MKNVFNSNQQTAHVWAAQGQSSGRSSGGNVYFSGDTIYSYGAHYPMARIYSIGEGREHKYFALLNSETYSVSTSGQMSDVRSALRGRMDYIYVPHPANAEATDNEIYLENCIANEMADILNTRTQAYSADLERLENCIGELNQFRSYFTKKAPFYLDAETLEVLQALKKEKYSKRAEKQKAKQEKAALIAQNARAFYGPQIDLWISHANTEKYIPSNMFPFDMVRVSKDKSRIETSRGAEVPMRAAKFAIEMVDKNHPIKDFTLGHFTIETEPDEKGFIKIGCHRININQVRHALKVAGE